MKNICEFILRFSAEKYRIDLKTLSSNESFPLISRFPLFIFFFNLEIKCVKLGQNQKMWTL